MDPAVPDQPAALRVGRGVLPRPGAAPCRLRTLAPVRPATRFCVTPSAGCSLPWGPGGQHRTQTPGDLGLDRRTSRLLPSECRGGVGALSPPGQGRGGPGAGGRPQTSFQWAPSCLCTCLPQGQFPGPPPVTGRGWGRRRAGPHRADPERGPGSRHRPCGNVSHPARQPRGPPAGGGTVPGAGRRTKPLCAPRAGPPQRTEAGSARPESPSQGSQGCAGTVATNQSPRGQPRPEGIVGDSLRFS